jgi:hypothetical protein
VAVLVDPGTLAYTVDPAARNRFRHTASHNAVTVDGEPSSVTAGPFSWARTATTRLERFASTSEIDWFRGSHDGFARVQGSANYTRTIAFIRDGLWIIRDAVVAQRTVVVEAHFQCGVGIEARAQSPHVVRLLSGGDRCADFWTADRSARITVETGQVSPAFGASVSAPHLRFSAPAAREANLHTVIGAPDFAIEQVDVVPIGTGSVVTITSRDHVEVLGFGANESDVHTIRAQAEAWWVRFERDSRRVVAWSGLECTHLSVADTDLHQSSTASIVSNP